MSVRKLLHHPDKKLREKSRLVSDEEITSEEVQTLIDDMMETVKAENGVGLAAPQVDKHLRIIIVETDDGTKAFVNPKIVSRSIKMVESQEGCLSIPGVHGMVKRHKNVKVRAKTREGKSIRLKTTGLPSIIFQHEIDHLDGILFIDRAYKVQEMTPELEGQII